MYLLDTCTISDFVRGDINTSRVLKENSPLLISTSSITHMEILYGLEKNPAIEYKVGAVIRDFLKTIKILNYCSIAAIHSSKIKDFLMKQGQNIGSYDILIAGVALAHNLTLVTSNEKEFKRIPDLQIKNWRT